MTTTAGADDGDRDGLKADFVSYVISMAAQITEWADALAGDDEILRGQLAAVQETFLHRTIKTLP